MTLSEIIQKRRAYRALEKTKITQELVNDLVTNAQLAPSCFNYQPWRYVFVYDDEMLQKMFSTLSESNKWVHKASMIIAVFSKKEFDCTPGKSREYYLFDTGMATAFMILKGTELGLVMHPIAGYSHRKVKEVLEIPEDMIVITLVIVGKHSNDDSLLSEKQKTTELKRPSRKKINEFVYLNKYTTE
ncbi:MAG: nitroreductase [Asgard group archaeon]|nr:nitroreductase [Asgard group archaeon]